MNKKMMIGLVSFACSVVLCSAADLQTKYGNNTGGNATNLHAAGSGQLIVKHIGAQLAGATGNGGLAAYGRTGSPSIVASNGANSTQVYLSNTGTNIATSELVALQLQNGNIYIVSVTTATESVVGIAPGVTVSNGDKMYELGQIAAWSLGVTAYNQSGDAIIASPVDSPLYFVSTSTNTSATITTTVQR